MTQSFWLLLVEGLLLTRRKRAVAATQPCACDALCSNGARLGASHLMHAAVRKRKDCRAYKTHFLFLTARYAQMQRYTGAEGQFKRRNLYGAARG